MWKTKAVNNITCIIVFKYRLIQTFWTNLVHYWDSSEQWSASMKYARVLVVVYDFLSVNLNFVLPLIRSLLLTEALDESQWE